MTTPGRTRKDWLAITHLALLFLPYAAVPLGASSNLPLWVLTGALLILTRHRQLRHGWLLFFLFLAPLASAFALQWATPPPLQGVVTWFLYLSGIPAAMVIARQTPLPQIRKTLQLTIGVTSAYAIVQYLLLGQGVVLRWLVQPTLQGFANIASLDDIVISVYQQRAFGWFPEPSFLAGTVILAALALFFVEAQEDVATKWTTRVIVLASVAAILAKSGTVLVGLPVLGWILLSRVKTKGGRLLGIFAVIPLVVWQVARLFEERTGSGEFSWAERAASITTLLDLQSATFGGLLFGIGRGQSTVFYEQTRVAVTAGTGTIDGVYGIFSRVVIEQGLIFGWLPVIALVLVTLRSALRVTKPGLAVAAVGVWAFFSAVVLAYETTSMVWAFSGLVLGLGSLQARRPLTNGGVPGRRAGVDPRAGAAVLPGVHVVLRSRDGRRTRP